jgi:hypothetical protein
MIQFNLDHTTQLRNSIASFQAIYSEEWLDLIQRLQDLQQVWNDTHRLDFEQDFQSLTTTHQRIAQDLEHHLQELDRVVETTEKINDALVIFNFSDQKSADSQAKSQTVINKAESNNADRQSPEFTEESVQNWQTMWRELSEKVTPFFDKTIAFTTISMSLFGGIMSSSPVMQATKLSRGMLTSSIESIVGDFQDILGVSNDTIGADWSKLSDDAIPKVIAKITEDAENLHFGSEDAADLAEEYGDYQEEERKRRRREQEILNALRSKYFQQSRQK